MGSFARKMDATAKAQHVRDSLPEGGLFKGHNWRIAPEPFQLEPMFVKELEALGPVLLKFYKAADLLYRQSVNGKQPTWVCEWLDQGKPASLIQLQRHPQLKTSLPRVIRPDILLTEDGWQITELDSVPGGIGLTAWLNQTYGNQADIIGGPTGMIDGFTNIFGDARNVHLMVSEESATYRPEMEWLAKQIGPHFSVRDSDYSGIKERDSLYRFFELFDLENIESAYQIFELACSGLINITAPPKSYLEEKMLFALFWNRNLQSFWQRELGGRFVERMENIIPNTWLIDPAPLPPQGAFPGLNLTDWRQLSELSQKDRQLVLKLSGFNANAWGARSVRLGSDMPQREWAAAVNEAIADFGKSPWILQRYHKPRRMDHEWFDFDNRKLVTMSGRVRLCPYYFVHGDSDVNLGGVLATICPADKKIIHGMRDAILTSCAVSKN
jgi:hypothetical protein